MQAKLLIPLVGLMIASLMLSTLAFIAGTTRTQYQLLEQQFQQDVQRGQQALLTRAYLMGTAARRHRLCGHRHPGRRAEGAVG